LYVGMPQSCSWGNMKSFKQFLEQKSPNFVAKHAYKYNKSSVQKDKKKEIKKGYTKHKGAQQ